MAPRIAVIGTSGNGKTTVARQLAQRLGVPHIELDALFHGPNWTETPLDEFRRRVAAAKEPDGRVVDGNYHSKLGDLVLRRADTVVWLDQPLPLLVWRITRRTIRRIRRGEELWNGNRESWRGGFFGWESMFWWTIRSYFARRRLYPDRLSAHPRVVRLRSRKALKRWLSGAARDLEAARPVVSDGRAGKARTS
jgi:adenylate kinase family enzyme